MASYPVAATAGDCGRVEVAQLISSGAQKYSVTGE